MSGGGAPCPPEEALRIARQIGEALDAAHEKNIVHRDLKPANVKIKHDGLVKVLQVAKIRRVDLQNRWEWILRVMAGRVRFKTAGAGSRW